MTDSNGTMAPTSTTWQIDPAHTSVEFSVRHLMISKVKGRFSKVSGTLTGNAQRPGDFKVDVALDVDSLDTRQSDRDAHLRSPDFFDAQKWPSIHFTGKKIEGDVQKEFKLIGDLTIRDVTREVQLDVTNEGSVKDPWGNDRVGFSAKTRVDRKDFGLTYNQALETGGFVVGDEISISVDAEFTAVAAESEAAA